MYTTGRGGRGIFFGGEVFKFFEGKRGDDKNVWRQEGRMTMFLDLSERLSICNIIDKPLRKWSSLFSSSMKDVFISNALNCNVLYFVQ